jgi:hypothetical protein
MITLLRARNKRETILESDRPTSLVFVGVQIRLAWKQALHADKTALSRNYIALMEMNNACQRCVMEDAQLASAFRIAMDGGEPQEEPLRTQLGF